MLSQIFLKKIVFIPTFTLQRSGYFCRISSDIFFLLKINSMLSKARYVEIFRESNWFVFKTKQRTILWKIITGWCYNLISYLKGTKFNYPLVCVCALLLSYYTCSLLLNCTLCRCTVNRLYAVIPWHLTT